MVPPQSRLGGAGEIGRVSRVLQAAIWPRPLDRLARSRFVREEHNTGLLPSQSVGANGAAPAKRRRVHTIPLQRPQRIPWRKRAKLLLFGLARASGLCRLSRWLTRRSVLIIGWHCVSLTDEHERFPSLFISPETFRRRLEFLKKHYQIITLDEALRQKRAGRFAPNQAVLTFDDGYYNVYAQAASILREMGMPGTVYMVTARIDSQIPTYNHLVSDIILSSTKKSAQLTAPGIEGQVALATQDDRVSFMRRAIRAYPTDASRQESFVQNLANDLGVDLGDLIGRRVWHCMNAAEVDELRKIGLIDFQLHTHEHKNVTDHPEEAFEQVRVCREQLEALTGRPARHFCYPQGFWNKAAWESLERNGVESATTTQHGPNLIGTPDLALRRLPDGESRTQL